MSDLDDPAAAAKRGNGRFDVRGALKVFEPLWLDQPQHLYLAQILLERVDDLIRRTTDDHCRRLSHPGLVLFRRWGWRDRRIGAPHEERATRHFEQPSTIGLPQPEKIAPADAAVLCHEHHHSESEDENRIHTLRMPALSMRARFQVSD